MRATEHYRYHNAFEITFATQICVNSQKFIHVASEHYPNSCRIHLHLKHKTTVHLTLTEIKCALEVNVFNSSCLYAKTNNTRKYVLITVIRRKRIKSHENQTALIFV